MANDYAYVKASVARRVEWMQTLKARPCMRCGTRKDPEQMHWHHRDPATKAFSIAKGAWRVGRERLLAEIAKCDLLCDDCHMAHHAPPVPCGTARAYRRGCRCLACKSANAERSRRQRQGKAA